MRTNFKIVVEYDGRKYSGWQIQKDRITIQSELEKALSIILNQNIKVFGSGRTDAGVHAYGQVANFIANTELSCEIIKKGVNSIIKGSVVIRKCDIVHEDFHARHDAVSKEYHYHILNRDDPCAIQRHYMWHVKKKLDLKQMQECCKIIKGKHDFKSFEGSGSPKYTTIREIFSAEFFMEANHNNHDNDNIDRIIFKISANGFLKFMVRNLIGTIVLAGLLKIDTQQFKDILNAKDRNLAGPTAPAHGLFLMNVKYP
ncbi:MAG: tRNA pseudouridine(38-40) synthase TruA [Desulfobacterales bacterium]|nr:tRNA pseudouridine(38-40) synthase TruA [Desulfobacterales bacterium]